MDLKLLKMRFKDIKQHHVMIHELYSVSLLLCIAQNVRFEIPYKVLYFETPFLIILKYYAWVSCGKTSLDDVTLKYALEAEELPFKLASKTVFTFLQEILGNEVTVVRPRSNGKQLKVFLNVCERDAESRESFMQIDSSALGWILRSDANRKDGELKLCKLTGEKVNGNELVLELNMNVQSLEFTLSGMLGKTFNNADQGCSFIFSLTSRSLKFRRGVQKDSHAAAVSRKPREDKHCIEIKCNGEEIVISKHCLMFLEAGSKSAARTIAPANLKHRHAMRAEPMTFFFSQYGEIYPDNLSPNPSAPPHPHPHQKNLVVTW